MELIMFTISIKITSTHLAPYLEKAEDLCIK